LYGLESLLEKLTAKFLEFSTSDGLLEVDSISNTFNCDFNLMD
jgi:hypothetical protein